MSLFGYSKTAALPTEDRVGGYTLPETGIYPIKVKAVYLTPKDKGGVSATVLGELTVNGKPKDVTYVLHPIVVKKDSNNQPIRNADGSFVQGNTYIGKKDQKEYYVEDFLLLDSLAKLTVGKPLADLATNEIILELMDYDLNEKRPKAVQAWTDFQGAELHVVNQRIIKNKMKKMGDEYVETAETKQEIKVLKFLDYATSRTSTEIENGVLTGEYAAAWTKQWAGKDSDQTKQTKGKGHGTAGLPTKPASNVIMTGTFE